MRMQKVCSCNSDSPWLSTSHTEFVGTLAPQERPFLRSNQITTSYVNRCNVRYNKMSASMHNLNAYDERTRTSKQFSQQSEIKKIKAQKVLRQSMQTFQHFVRQKAEEEEKLEHQVKEIEGMQEKIFTKASDIMYGRNTSNYYRNMSDMFANTPKELKKIRNSTSEGCLRKLECTRQLMQNYSGKIRDKQIENMARSTDQTEIMDESNNSTCSSFADVSQLSSKNKTLKNKKLQKGGVLKKLLTNKTYEQVFAAKRRQITSMAFANFWKQGSENKKTQNMPLSGEKEVESLFGNRKHRKIDSSPSVLEQLGKDENCGMLVCKKYGQFFTKRAGLLKIAEK